MKYDHIWIERGDEFIKQNSRDLILKMRRGNCTNCIALDDDDFEALRVAVDLRVKAIEKANRKYGFPIKVLVAPGVTVPVESLSEKEQMEVSEQTKMVFEVAELDITETDELLRGEEGDCGKEKAVGT